MVELTELVELDGWPDGTRLIVRRERPHPGAQLSLFDTIEGMRHTAFITNQTGADIAQLELRQRQRARAENVIRDAKATGLANLPFDDIVNNQVWMQTTRFAEPLYRVSEPLHPAHFRSALNPRKQPGRWPSWLPDLYSAGSFR